MGSTTLEMYAIADETLLQLSKFHFSPFNLTAFWRISLKFSDQVWHKITMSGIRRRVHAVFQATWVFAHPAQFDTRFENGVVCGPSYLFDWRATCVCCVARWQCHWFDPEASRKRTREQKWIGVPEETAEVVVGGPKLYGSSRRDIFTVVEHFIDYFHSGFWCVEAGVETWCSSCFGVWAWLDLMGYSQYILLLAFGTPIDQWTTPPDCRWWWL